MYINDIMGDHRASDLVVLMEVSQNTLWKIVYFILYLQIFMVE